MGLQNRLNLIRYLLQDVNLLILDENLANVDEKVRETIILAMKRILQNRMFLYISNHLMEVSTFCDQILVFGASAACKSYVIVEGQNCRKDYAGTYALEASLSLEKSMGCGFGGCVGCVTKIVTDTEAGYTYKKVCKDGPVFDAREVLFL